MITLILLSVITFMAITFLVLATRDRGSVTTTTDQNNARYAADAALERAKSEAIALMQATTNSFNYDLFVSQAYRRGAGYDPNAFIGPNGASVTNVNYDYTIASAALTPIQFLQNLANLYIDPMAPVYVFNRATRSNDFRYYVDLNRSGFFEPTGLLSLTNDAGQQMFNPTNSAIPLTDYLVGDPQWIGILERPGFPHSPSNRFVARIAYIALPVSKTLDVNYLHNVGNTIFSGSAPANPIWLSGNHEYLRDQGLGSWEINLAALFRDLNTNMWPLGTYSYHGGDVSVAANSGNAFDDARYFLGYRNRDFQTELNKSVFALFGKRGAQAFLGDHLDGYCNGAPMHGTTLSAIDSDLVNTFWFGADNTNHFFTTQDFFDSSKTALGSPLGRVTFSDRISLKKPAGINVSSYNRYTFYRLLGQLGVDSAPESTTKMNLNYDNLVRGITNGAVIIPPAATNFLGWNNATAFFTNAASRLFTDTFGNNKVLNLGRIPIASTNLYTASVHRLLQIAANLYDTTTNYTGNSGNTTLGFPTVFRPLFRRESSGEIIIAGYREVQGTDIAFAGSAPPMAELDTGLNVNLIPTVGTPFNTSDQSEPLVSGIPLIVGAKKGWPNFNALGMQTFFQMTRKLQFLRPPKGAAPLETNVMYLVSITNNVGVEAWNSYTNSTTRDLQLIAAVDMTAIVTNDTGLTLLSNRVGRPFVSTINRGNWAGFNNFNNAGPSFQFVIDPASTNSTFYFLTNSQYSKPKEAFIALQYPFPDDPTGFPVPHLWLKLNTRLRFIMIDVAEKRIVDYVNLDSYFASPENRWDLTALMTTGGKCDQPRVPDGSIGSIFCTNRLGGNTDAYPTYGMLNQIDVSYYGASGVQGGIPNASWNSFQQTPQGYDQLGAVNFFRYNINSNEPPIPGTDAKKLYLTNEFYAPYAPTRGISFYTAWSVNDPLVHYMIDDLKDFGAVTNVEFESVSQSPIPDLVSRQISKRYDPWGGNPKYPSVDATRKFDLGRKDPGMFRSDAWDFPTNRWPNIGWIGRVHRGTPWQTVYLKQPAADPALWKIHSGNARVLTNKGQLSFSLVASNALYEDAGLSRPTNDWRLVELFTTAVSDNASRGQMSVNQSGLAAWSAVLSGMITLTNNASNSYFVSLLRNTPAGQPLPPPPTAGVVIDPAGYYDIYDNTVPIPPLVQIVNAINRTRGDTNLFPKQVFSHLGDILKVPELTVASPFLNRSSAVQLQYGLNDEIYERIPQQIFGLLKIDTTPRYVVYSWGQALKPADRSVIMSGPYSGLCTNYQISAEVETRTTLRIEGGPDNPRVIVENYNIMPPE